jgi:Ca2+-binding RTX toxin-like protein
MATIHGTNFSDNNTRQGIPFFETLIPEINRRSRTERDDIYGLAGSDIIKAGSGSDVIYGDRSSSQQTAVGLQGNDLIYAGGGNDTVYGDGGNDLLYGESGNDNLYGGTGNDRLFGGAGADVLRGDSGNDVLYGDDSDTSTSGGNDILIGGAGNDHLFGRYGQDVLQGQSSSSLLSAFEKDVLTGGAGQDTFVVADLYRDGGLNDYAHITDWAAGGVRDRLDVTDPNNIILSQVDSNTFEVFQATRTSTLLGFGDPIRDELVARIDSSTLINAGLEASIRAGLF